MDVHQRIPFFGMLSAMFDREALSAPPKHSLFSSTHLDMPIHGPIIHRRLRMEILTQSVRLRAEAPLVQHSLGLVNDEDSLHRIRRKRIDFGRQLAKDIDSFFQGQFPAVYGHVQDSREHDPCEPPRFCEGEVGVDAQHVVELPFAVIGTLQERIEDVQDCVVALNRIGCFWVCAMIDDCQTF